MSVPDAELVARVIERDDRRAFAELVRRHQSAIRRLLRKLACGDAALADDLAQESFLRAYRGLRHYRGVGQLSSWLYRIACNVFLNDRRRRYEEPRELDEAAAAATTIGPPHGGAILRLDLERAFAVLTPHERTAIALAYGMEATHEDIAEILERPLGTVKTDIARGKEKLRRRLDAWENRGSA